MSNVSEFGMDAFRKGQGQSDNEKAEAVRRLLAQA